jgi:hypothetical protein
MWEIHKPLYLITGNISPPLAPKVHALFSCCDLALRFLDLGTATLHIDIRLGGDLT